MSVQGIIVHTEKMFIDTLKPQVTNSISVPALSLQSVSIVDVINNVLYEENQVGWELLQQSDVGSQALLNNAERYALFVARATKDTAENVTVSRDNVGKLMTTCILSTL